MSALRRRHVLSRRTARLRRARAAARPSRFGRIAGGQDEVKGKIFRLGHMGTVSNEELVGGIFAIERALLAQGASIKRGAWVEAFGSHVK